MKVNLLIVATGKYTQFLEGLLKSADKYFLRGCEVTYCVFSDQSPEVETKRKVKIFNVEHGKWPHSTLKRFHFFKEHRDKVPKADYLFYIDADTLVNDEIGDEILGELVAVIHCGFLQERGTYETRPESTACIYPNEGSKYFGGGFLGGSALEFWAMVETLAKAIDTDERNGILAIHNDESHWNRYLVDNTPTIVLSPAYHYPENHPHVYGKWRKVGVNFECKILLLQKNHSEIRE